MKTQHNMLEVAPHSCWIGLPKVSCPAKVYYAIVLGKRTMFQDLSADVRSPTDLLRWTNKTIGCLNCPMNRNWFLWCIPLHLRTKFKYDEHLWLDELAENGGGESCINATDGRVLQSRSAKPPWEFLRTTILPLQLLPRLEVPFPTTLL